MIAESPSGRGAASASLSGDPAYALFCEARLEDPYRLLEAMREEEPVHWSPLLEAWVVTRHDLVVEALRSGTLRNDRVSINMRAVPAADRARYRGLETHISNWLGFTDPPKHTRMRQVARQILTHEAAQRLRPAAKAMALAELERLSSLRRLDLVEELALDIPLRMICATLGVPEEEAACFHRWSADIAAFAGIVNPDQALLARAIERANESWLEAEEYFARLLELRRSDPRDDGVSVLAAALAAGQLDRDEAIGLCVFVLAAGHGTTAALLGNMAMLLMGDAAQRQALGTGRGLVGRAVEEVLRYESPIPMMSRLAGAELSLAGRRIREGDPVVLQLSAANRDPARFSEPAAFRVEREENRHLAFGSGAHFCLGAPLARAQAGSVLEALLESELLDRWQMEDPPSWRLGSPDARDQITLVVRAGDA